MFYFKCGDLGVDVLVLKMRNLTSLADNVDIFVRVRLPDLFLKGVWKVFVKGQDNVTHHTSDHGNKNLASVTSARMLFTHMWYSCWVLRALCARGCCSTCLHRRLAAFLGSRLPSIWGAQCRCGPHLKINKNTSPTFIARTHIWCSCLFWTSKGPSFLSWMNRWIPCGYIRYHH